MLTAFLSSICLFVFQSEGYWRPLWPQGIDSWEQSGGEALYSFENGALTGQGAKGANAFLKREYTVLACFFD